MEGEANAKAENVELDSGAVLNEGNEQENEQLVIGEAEGGDIDVEGEADGTVDGDAADQADGGEPTVEEPGPENFMTERQSKKHLEIFVGGLDKETTEEDLRPIFEEVGTVEEVRIMKNPQTGKCKGYAFIRYATAAEAKQATAKFKEIEVRGRMVGVLPSEENSTLFLGNINKTWTKEMVSETLLKYVEKFDDLTLMEDPQHEGMSRGFAFVDFENHKEARKGYQRLSQSDCTFGLERSAKVSWAEPLNDPDEETMAQVKSVFVDGMPPSWEEEKVTEYFGKYGEVERVVLARNLSSAKRKDFGFVNYKEREAALACIEALNNSEINDGEVKMKLKVTLAKPQVKKQAGRGGARGGGPGRGDGRGGGRGGRGGRFGFDDPGRGFGFAARGARGGRFAGGGRLGRGGRDLNLNDNSSISELLKVVREQEKETEKSQPRAAAKPSKASGDAAATNKDQKKSAEGEGAAAAAAGGEGGDKQKKEKEAVPADKFECATCVFGTDAEGLYYKHMKSRVHRVITLIRSGDKQVTKTPLSLLHEYASRNKGQVTYDPPKTAEGGLGPFEITANVSTQTGTLKGTGTARLKNKAKQMAAAAVLEQLMRTVPESDFTRPGASKMKVADTARGALGGRYGADVGRGGYPQEGPFVERGGGGYGGYGGTRPAYPGRRGYPSERTPYEPRGMEPRGMEARGIEPRGMGYDRRMAPPPAYEREIPVRAGPPSRYGGGYEGGRRPYVEEPPYVDEPDMYSAPPSRRVGLPPAYAVRAAAAAAAAPVVSQPQQQPQQRYEEPMPPNAYGVSQYSVQSRYDSAPHGQMAAAPAATERPLPYSRSAAPSMGGAAAAMGGAAQVPASAYSLSATGYIEDARTVLGTKRPYGAVEEVPRYADPVRAVQRPRIEEQPPPQQQISSSQAPGYSYRSAAAGYENPRSSVVSQQQQQPRTQQQQQQPYGSSNSYAAAGGVDSRASQQQQQQQQLSQWSSMASAPAPVSATQQQSASQQAYSIDQPSSYVPAGGGGTSSVAPVGGLYQTNTGYGVSYSVADNYLSGAQGASAQGYQPASYNAGASAMGGSSQAAYGNVQSTQGYY